MAVKRVILQHFSMRYDYMTKERPNIYQPSVISDFSNQQCKINNFNSKQSIMGNRSNSNNSNSYFKRINTPLSSNKVDLVDGHCNNLYYLEEQLGKDDYDDDKNAIDLVSSDGDTSDFRGNGYYNNHHQQQQKNQKDNIKDNVTTTDNARDTLTKLNMLNLNDVVQQQNKKTVETIDKTGGAGVGAGEFKKPILPTNNTMNKKIKSNKNNYLPIVAEKSTGYNSDEDDSDDIVTGEMQPPTTKYRTVKKDTNHKRQAFLKQQNNLSNWRSEQKSLERPIVFRNNYRQSGSSMSSPSYHHHNNYNYNVATAAAAPVTATNNEITNWRKECLYSSVRNCGHMAATSSSSSSSSTTPVTSEYHNNKVSGIGLSPPSESLLMQRRMKLLKTNEINNPPATVSG